MDIPSTRANEPPLQYGPTRARKTFVLCFDGTGNKFSGSDGDSNIIKIYRMLDRSDPNQLHYYQPGIGTYVDTKSFSHTSHIARLNSWYQKAKDSAVGSSFDKHVMGGYMFLMRYYSSGDDIFFFGFSRGAYVARFLAEMLDHVGLLSAGNEEMARFAWKAFAQWQQRQDKTDEEKAQKLKMFNFLTAFRETFSRPVRRIRFLGLFDTVNSVPRFENAWMQRSKFPYTARSSALVIRHAVGIDERRAKFRQDLISETKASDQRQVLRGRERREELTDSRGYGDISQKVAERRNAMVSERFRRPSQSRLNVQKDPRERTSPSRSLGVSERDMISLKSTSSQVSLNVLRKSPEDDDEADEAAPQDIEEIWFPGCHADIGGGWTLFPGEEVPLSHGPLVWIVREARKAGLRFDYETMRKMRCCDDDFDNLATWTATVNTPSHAPVPELKVTDVGSPERGTPPANGVGSNAIVEAKTPSVFRQALHKAATRGKIHDCLLFNNGLPPGSVISWKLMEYLPFRRMDLQPDGTWLSISWPLPKGEVRDIPDGAWVHSSALQRMNANKDYRPGNLIVGGGGRGVRKAPPELGIGQWDILREEGDPVGEVWVKKMKIQVNGTEMEK